MTEFTSKDGRSLFLADDGNVRQLASSALKLDAECAARNRRRLLTTSDESYDLSKVFLALAKQQVSPGKVKRAYRGVFKLMRLAIEHEAAEKVNANAQAELKDLPY